MNDLVLPTGLWAQMARLRLIIWLAVMLIAATARAHYCGYPVVRCQPGDIVKYEIIADVAEDELSLYDVFDQSDPFVAPVVFFTPISAIRGLFVFEARQVGTNQADMFWSFPPNTASGFCVFDVRVSTNWSSGTAGENPFSGYYGDPVNMFSGELVVREVPDLSLGGPLPLFFTRYYASGLQSAALVKSALGNNWSHNFDWSAIVLTNRAVIISPEGFNVHFDRTGSTWTLTRPTHLPYQLVNSGTNVVFGDLRDNLIYTFATNGLLLSISDGKGNQHTLTYENDIQLAQVSDGLGRTLTFTYGGAQLLRRVTDGTRTVGFNQAQLGPQFNLTRATNALGRATTYTYDNFNGDGSLLTSTVLPLGNTFYSQVYDAAGRVIQQSRLGTNVTRFAYDTNAFKSYATNALDHVTVFQHSADGQLLGVTDSASEAVALMTNALGLRSTFTSRSGGAVGLAYDPASRKPSALTNANGGVTLFTYTNRTVNGIVLYDLSSVTTPDGTTERYTYDAVGKLIARQDQAGGLTQYTYNSRGQWLGVTNPAGGVITFTHNSDGTLATRSDAETGLTAIFYDASRRPTNAVAADGRSLRLSFNALNQVLASTDARTNTTFFSYDANDRLTGATNALGQVVRFGYDTADRLTTVTDRLGRPTGYAYDGLDQVLSVTNRNGQRTSLGWDSRQRLATVTDPGNENWLLGYNDEALLTSATDPLGNGFQRALDAAGFVSAITNATGQAVLFQRDLRHQVIATEDALGRAREFAYDARGILTNTTLPGIGAAGYAPDELGRLQTLTDQNGQQWGFDYTALGRRLTMVDPLNRTKSVSYDASGRARRLAFADGATATNTFDGAGNITRRDFSDGLVVNYGYDPLNRLTNTTALALAYDAEDRITNTVSSGINFGAAYDNDGRVTNVTYNGGALVVTYAYDSRDRLIQVNDNLTAAQLNFFYDAAGRLTNVVRANAVNGIYDYDAGGRLTRLREGGFIDLKYTLNAAGEIAFVDSTAPLSAAPASAATNQLSFDDAHQINSPGFSYDARGRLIASPGHTFAWNASSHLTRIDSVTNTYNGMGDLLTRSTAAGTVRYHYNHALGLTPIVAEQDAGTAEFLHYYIWSPSGELLYMIDASSGNAVSYYHFDRTGSTLALTSGAGTVTDAYAYSLFGVLAARTGSNPQPFTYVGRYGVRAESAANLYHMRARYYEPGSARFLSPDPVWPRPENPLSLNPYAYAANNPLQFIDPLGTREDQVEIAARLAVVAVSLHLNSLGIDPFAELRPGRGNLAPFLFHPLILMQIYLQALDPMYLRHQMELARYNQLTRIVKQHPGLAARSLFGFGRSYDPAVRAAVTGYPMAALLVQNSNLKIWAALQEDEAETLAYARYVRQIPDSLVNRVAPWQIQLLADATGIAPSQIIPRGRVWVNGQLVEPKLADLIHGAFELRALYDSLEEDDIWPEDVLDDLLDRLLGRESRPYPIQVRQD